MLSTVCECRVLDVEICDTLTLSGLQIVIILCLVNVDWRALYLVGFLGLNLLPHGRVLRIVDDFNLSVGRETIQDVELHVCQCEQMFLR